MADKKDKADDTPRDELKTIPAKPARQKPAIAAKKAGPEVFPIENIAADQGIAAWEVVGMMQAVGWFPGKQVTEIEFSDALARFRNRPQGSGKI